MALLHRLRQFLTRELFPPTCLSCAEYNQGEQLFCMSCWGKLIFIEDPLCRSCGFPFLYLEKAYESMPVTDKTTEDLICPSCLKRPPEYDCALSLYVYGSPIREVILSFKHGDRTDLAPVLSDLLHVKAEQLPSFDGVLPVPLHWRRRFKRQYNQAGLLAAGIAKKRLCPLYHNILRRKKATVSQGLFSPKKRQQNMKNAFEISPGHQKTIAGKTLLLIDDVYTTGATVSECARVLKKKGGAKAVYVLTLCRSLLDH